MPVVRFPNTPHIRDICDRLIVRVKVTYIWYQMIPVKGKVNGIKYELPYHLAFLAFSAQEPYKLYTGLPAFDELLKRFHQIIARGLLECDKNVSNIDRNKNNTGKRRHITSV